MDSVELQNPVMDEIEEIKRKYDAGQLEHIRTDLERFIVAHRADILKLKSDLAARPRRGEVSHELAIKLFVLKYKSINPVSEIREELEEIQKEKWIQGVKMGRAPDPNEVAREWARKYSKGWREHRVLSIIYVFEREKDRYIHLLAPPEGPRS